MAGRRYAVYVWAGVCWVLSGVSLAGAWAVWSREPRHRDTPAVSSWSLLLLLTREWVAVFSEISGSSARLAIRSCRMSGHDDHRNVVQAVSHGGSQMSLRSAWPAALVLRWPEDCGLESRKSAAFSRLGGVGACIRPGGAAPGRQRKSSAP